MPKERSTAFIFSALLHAVILLLLIVGLPDFLSKRPPPEPLVLTVELLPVSELTNVKPSESTPVKEPKKEEKKPEAKKPTPPVKTADPTPPPPPKPEEKPAPEKPKEEKPVEKPKEEKKEEAKPEKKPKKEDDLLDVLKAVKEQAAKEQADKPDKKVKEESSDASVKSQVPYDPNVPISLSVRDSIRQQIYKCWSVNAGAKNAHELVVSVEIAYNPDGTLKDAQYTKATRLKMSDPTFRTAAENAMRALKKPECNPLKGLPPEKYEGWSYMEFTFDPKDMLY